MVISKQLLPIYDKPMIYYPLTTLMLAGISEILIISTPRDLPVFRSLLGDGASWGLKLQYAEQKEPRGLAEALIIGEDFLAGHPSCLILGDNVFFGQTLRMTLQKAGLNEEGATIFGYRVRDPKDFGVLELGTSGRVISIEEKPHQPKSNFAVPGLYFYDAQAPGLARQLKPSARGELEITDLNLEYLKRGRLSAEIIGRGVAWLDTGTHASLLQASLFIETLESRQGLKVGCPEEVAYRMKFISLENLDALARTLLRSGYGEYLMQIVNEERALARGAQ
jgi:glucose-1-phosphate thymidylyltransferase